MKRLAAIILTYNESEHITACLETTAFADLQVVFDSFSNDNTLDLARAAGAEVIQHEFVNFAQYRNAALDAVRGRVEWVLFVDADERIPPELAAEIQQRLDEPACAGYRIPRHNYIFGTLTTGAGWYPDYQTRLLKVDSAQYDPERKVHEIVLLDGEEGTLNEHIVHYNYKDVQHFIMKQQKYVRYDAQIMFEQGIRPKLRNYILQPLRHFRWRFVQLHGYRDGWHGFRLSALMAWYELRKYMILGQLWRNA